MDKVKTVPELRFPGFDGEWSRIILNEISEKISDGYHGTPIYDDCGEYYFINGNNLVNDRVLFTETTKKVGSSQFAIHQRPLHNNTILLSINGTIGNLALYKNEKIILGKSACYINLTNDNDSSFIYNQLKTSKINDYFISELTGSTIKNLSLATIKNTEVAIPSKSEQQKIASFLTSVDEKLTQLKQKKSLLEKYKAGVMQQIFSQEIRFKDDDGNEFPEWEEKRLAEIGSFFSGGTPLTTKKQYFNGNIPFIRSGEIKSDHTEQFISELGLKSSSSKMVKKGDLLFALYGATSGEVAISKINGAINQAILCIRTVLDTCFLYNYLLFQKETIINTYLQGGQGNLSAEIIKSIRVPVPQQAEQTKIADFLSALDDKINHCADQISKMEQWKKGVLQKMFC